MNALYSPRQAVFLLYLLKTSKEKNDKNITTAFASSIQTTQYGKLSSSELNTNRGAMQSWWTATTNRFKLQRRLCLLPTNELPIAAAIPLCCR